LLEEGLAVLAELGADHERRRVHRGLADWFDRTGRPQDARAHRERAEAITVMSDVS
jgi:hypothetical protein